MAVAFVESRDKYGKLANIRWQWILWIIMFNDVFISLFSFKSSVKPGYNDIGLCNKSVARDVLWYQLNPHC